MSNNSNMFLKLLLVVVTMVSPLGARVLKTEKTESTPHLINVQDFGAVGDGVTDDSEAFKEAWTAACFGGSDLPTISIPSGWSFLLQPTVLQGPCMSNITIQIDGNIVAPGELSDWNFEGGNGGAWIMIKHVNGLTISGSGTIDGSGLPWWSRPCAKTKTCPPAPTAIVIMSTTNVNISDLNFINSPQKHFSIESSSLVRATKLSIEAPHDSPNTDGIHVSKSKYVELSDLFIGTGDDCISTGSATYINISRIHCGPGHGISIGSLRGTEEAPVEVEFVHVKDVSLFGTQNGVRIKTWEGGNGYARNIEFEDIQIDDVQHPIVIDQYYFSSHSPIKNNNTAVQLSNISFREIYGIPDRQVAVSLVCSSVVPCTNIYLHNISLNSTKDGNPTTSSCSNAHGFATGVISPTVPCLDTK